MRYHLFVDLTVSTRMKNAALKDMIISYDAVVHLQVFLQNSLTDEVHVTPG